MKKTLTWSLAFACLALTATSCSNPKPTVAAEATTAVPTPAAATAYVCPMHPTVVSAHPGKCPKCGMDLIVKK